MELMNWTSLWVMILTLGLNTLVFREILVKLMSSRRFLRTFIFGYTNSISNFEKLTSINMELNGRCTGTISSTAKKSILASFSRTRCPKMFSRFLDKFASWALRESIICTTHCFEYFSWTPFEFWLSTVYQTMRKVTSWRVSLNQVPRCILSNFLKIF